MDCKILTINASGRIPNGVKVKGMEIPQKRRDVGDKVIWDVCSDIIFMQESTILFENMCYGYFKNLNYQSTGPKGKKRVRIIFNTSKFDFVEDPTTRLCQIYESKCIRGESADIFFRRMCATILKGTEEDAQPTLFVCWHGPHKEKLDEKKKIYNDLCLVLSLYASEKQIQVVLGGDFNLDLIKDKNLEVCPPTNPVGPDTIEVIDYMKLEQRPNKIDFILTSPKIIVVDCKPIDVFSITKNLFPELTEPFVKAIFDHDPIVVNVIIPNQEEVFSSLSELNLTKPYHEDIECLNEFLVTETKPYHKGFELLDQLSMTKPYNFFCLHYYLPYLLPIPLSNIYYNDHIQFLLPMPPPFQYYHDSLRFLLSMPPPIQYYNDSLRNPWPMPPPSQYYNDPLRNPWPMPPPIQYYNDPLRNPWPMPPPIQYYNDPLRNPWPMPPPIQYYNDPLRNPWPMPPPSQYYNYHAQYLSSRPPPSQYNKYYPLFHMSMPPPIQSYNDHPLYTWSMPLPKYYNDHIRYPLQKPPPIKPYITYTDIFF